MTACRASLPILPIYARWPWWSGQWHSVGVAWRCQVTVNRTSCRDTPLPGHHPRYSAIAKTRRCGLPSG